MNIDMEAGWRRLGAIGRATLKNLQVERALKRMGDVQPSYVTDPPSDVQVTGASAEYTSREAILMGALGQVEGGLFRLGMSLCCLPPPSLDQVHDKIGELSKRLEVATKEWQQEYCNAVLAELKAKEDAAIAASRAEALGEIALETVAPAGVEEAMRALRELLDACIVDFGLDDEDGDDEAVAYTKNGPAAAVTFGHLRRARAALAALARPASGTAVVPDGYVLVPVEPTEAMVSAGESAASFGIGKPTDADAIPSVYRAMIRAAAPPAKSEG